MYAHMQSTEADYVVGVNADSYSNGGHSNQLCESHA